MSKSFCFKILISCSLWPIFVTGAVQWDPASRTTIRDKIFDCRTILSVVGNDSVGIDLSASADLAETEAGLKELVEKQGREALLGSTLYRLGANMAESESKVVEPLRAVLTQLGFSEREIKIQVLSVPRTNLREATQTFLNALYERASYWLPSMKRDGQKPIAGEVTASVVATAAVEVPNVIYLAKSLPPLDAALTIAAHYAILTGYDIWTKSLVNWLLRPSPKDSVENKKIGLLKKAMLSVLPSEQKREKILSALRPFIPTVKQLSLALPFVVNYNVFGKITPIYNYIATNGIAAAFRIFPAELVAFSLTQGLTMFEQTMFYTTVMTRGVGVWQNSKQGDADSKLARVVAHINRVPILWFDAVFLAKASGAGSHKIFEYGFFSINTGHIDLLALTLAGSVITFYPKILDPTLHAAKWVVKSSLNPWRKMDSAKSLEPL